MGLPVRPLPPSLPEWLFKVAAANDNVEGVALAEEVVETGTVGVEVGAASAAYLLAPAATIFLAGDSSPQKLRARLFVPAIDKPPEGKGVMQWLDDMQDMSIRAAEMVVLQQQIRLLEEWGMGALTSPLKLQLEDLLSENQRVAGYFPVLGHQLQAMASAGSADVAPAETASNTDLFRRVQREVVTRIDREDYYIGILAWYEATILPQLQMILSEDPNLVFLLVNIPMYLKAGQLETTRRFCAPAANSLTSIIDDVASQYPNQVSVMHVGFESLRLADTVDLDQFKSLLDDMIRNAATHPKQAGEAVPITFEMSHGVVIMHADDDQHRLATAWDEVQRRAHQLGVDVEIDVEDHDGLFEIDPFQYVLTGRGDVHVMQLVVGEMLHEQRMSTLKEMDEIFARAEDQILSQALDMLATTGKGRFLVELRLTAIRFEQVVRLLIEDLHPQSRVAQQAMEMVKHLKVMAQYPREFF